MVSVSPTNIHAGNITGKLAKAKSAASTAAMGGIFCLLDFITVPGAFKLKYNTEGEKVDGVNWKSGFKELVKSAIKCTGYLAIPAVILGLASGAGIVAAGLAAGAAFGSSFLLSALFNKLLPEEKTLVAEACREKGIDIDAPHIDEVA